MRMIAYIQVMALVAVTQARWELYKLLSEPIRLRVLALSAVDELSVGELAELLGEGQPNVSRHAKALRSAGLLSVRREGTRSFISLTEGATEDPVVSDALATGNALGREDGSLERVAEVIAQRDRATREYFAQDRSGGDGTPSAWPMELGAYLSALAPLISPRSLAVDAGTGDGGLLDVIAPIFERVVAVDRADLQLSRARLRLEARGYSHIELFCGEIEDEAVLERVRSLGGADIVFASRVLHHAPKPAQSLAALGRLARKDGRVVVIDYLAHSDERMREERADLWLGFAPTELEKLGARAGLAVESVHPIESSRCGRGPDGHLDWQVMVARRAA